MPHVGITLLTSPAAFGEIAKIVGFVFFVATVAMAWSRVRG